MPARPAVFLSYPETSRRMWFGDRCVEAIRTVGEVILNPKNRVLSAAEIADLAGECGVIVLDRLTPIDGAVLDLLPKLLAVVRGGVDIRWIDVPAASERGILVTQVQAAYGPSVAEMVLGLMLAAARSIDHYAALYHRGQVPAVRPGQQIAGSVVGIIGYGVIARHLAAILLAMGASVIVYDPYAKPNPPVASCSLTELLAKADYVVPLAVATPETRGMLGKDEFARMKPSAWLINCSRGDLIDEPALAAALDADQIAGAALDVGWATDQLPTPELARRPKVIATPHVGGITQQSFESHGLQAVEQARSVFEGRMPAGAVNGPAAFRMKKASSRI